MLLWLVHFNYTGTVLVFPVDWIVFTVTFVAINFAMTKIKQIHVFDSTLIFIRVIVVLLKLQQ